MMEAVHCKTPEQAQKLLSYWYSLGRAWVDCSTDTLRYYHFNRADTVYFWENNLITYGIPRDAQQAYPNALQSFEEYFKNKPMNNQEIQQELKNLETRMAELRKKLDEPEKPVILPLVKDGKLVTCWSNEEPDYSGKGYSELQSGIHIKSDEHLFVAAESDYKLVVEESIYGTIAYITKK